MTLQADRVTQHVGCVHCSLWLLSILIRIYSHTHTHTHTHAPGALGRAHQGQSLCPQGSIEGCLEDTVVNHMSIVTVKVLNT